MKSSNLLIFAVPVVAALLSGCGDEPTQADPYRSAVGEAGVLRFEIDAEQPLAQGFNDLQISIHDVAEQAPVLGATLEFSATMPAMAHDLANAPHIHEAGDGTYVAFGVALTMAGRWELRVKAAQSSIQDEAVFEYDVP